MIEFRLENTNVENTNNKKRTTVDNKVLIFWKCHGEYCDNEGFLYVFKHIWNRGQVAVKCNKCGERILQGHSNMTREE